MISASLNSPEIGKNRFYLQNKFPIRNLIFQLENFSLKLSDTGGFLKRLTQTRVVSR